MVFLWSLQTVYGGNDWMVPRNKCKKEERSHMYADINVWNGLIASCECAHHSQKGKKNKKQKERFCISLAATS